MDRRTFLISLGAGAGAIGLGACSKDADKSSSGTTTVGGSATTTTTPLPVPKLAKDPFTLGVASGDPDPVSVILWTRLAMAPLAGGGMGDAAVPVNWEVASDQTFATIVANGTAAAEAKWGHAVHVTAENLASATQYWYRFRVGDYTSAVGQTMTTPAAGASVERLRFGFASCQDWQSGFYNAHRDIAATENLDLLLFLGDYIYEYGSSEVGKGNTKRTHGSDKATDLVAYRNRYALYRSDPHLQAAQARCPWVNIWDDHEVENNYAGLQSEDPKMTPADFTARRAAAYQAWYEHTPVRLDPPTGADYKIYRTFSWGSLATFFITDERQYRTDQACGDKTLKLTPACDEVNSDGRTLMGPDQLTWLLDGFDAATTTWRVWGNEVVMTPVTVGAAILNYDQWDGYPAERKVVLDHLKTKAITNLVVVTGDIHLAGVGDLTVGAGDTRETVATEFVGTSISSDGLLPPGTEQVVRSAVPAIKYVNSSQRGWTYCDVTATEWITEYRMVDNNLVDGSPVKVDARFRVTPDRAGATQL